MKECSQCGKCCEKSGPTLHIEDKYLVKQGKISPATLVTLRKGETAFDPVLGKTISLENELIKISGVGEVWTCRFYDPSTNKCTIYQARPIECRFLKCWDTKSILSIMNKNLLTREMLFGKIGGLYDFINEHDEKCSYSSVKELLNEFEKNKSNDILTKLKEIFLFDISIREILKEKQPAAGAMENLLFGRPFTQTIEQFKYKIKYSKKEGLKIFPFKLDKILEGTIS